MTADSDFLFKTMIELFLQYVYLNKRKKWVKKHYVIAQGTCT